MKTEKWVKYAAVTICAAGVFLVLFCLENISFPRFFRLRLLF